MLFRLQQNEITREKGTELSYVEILAHNCIPVHTLTHPPWHLRGNIKNNYCVLRFSHLHGLEGLY